MAQSFQNVKDTLIPIDQCSNFAKIQTQSFNGALVMSSKELVQKESHIPASKDIGGDAFTQKFAQNTRRMDKDLECPKNVSYVPAVPETKREILTNFAMVKQNVFQKDTIQVPPKDFKTEQFEKEKQQFDDNKRERDQIRKHFLQQRLKNRNQ